MQAWNAAFRAGWVESFLSPSLWWIKRILYIFGVHLALFLLKKIYLGLAAIYLHFNNTAGAKKRHKSQDFSIQHLTMDFMLSPPQNDRHLVNRCVYQFDMTGLSLNDTGQQDFKVLLKETSGRLWLLQGLNLHLSHWMLSSFMWSNSQWWYKELVKNPTKTIIWHSFCKTTTEVINLSMAYVVNCALELPKVAGNKTKLLHI